MAEEKQYWKNIEELSPEYQLSDDQLKEFAEEIPIEEFIGETSMLKNTHSSRRDFLKFVGFSTMAAAMASCEGPVRKSIPYLVTPEQLRSGIPNYYATSINDGYDFASILVKTREGRPIFIERNKEAGTFGCTNARIIASVLGLYDNSRIKKPTNAKKETVSWDFLSQEAQKAISKAISEHKEIVLLTQTLASPSTYALIEDIQRKVPQFSVVEYDAISHEPTLAAYERLYGQRALPDYDFSKSDLIISFAADFLGDWNGKSYEDTYAKGRVPSEKGMSRHIQLESNLSLSGANADWRIMLTPYECALVMKAFYNTLFGNPQEETLEGRLQKIVQQLCEEVKQAKNPLIVSDFNDRDLQQAAMELNEHLHCEAYLPHEPLLIRKGDYGKIASLLDQLENKKVGVLLIHNLNPVHTLSFGNGFKKYLKNADFVVDFTQHLDETAVCSSYVAPLHHYLEQWGDVCFKKSHYTLQQPVIRPLFDTKQLQDALMEWFGFEKTYYDYLKSHWKKHILKGISWEKALQDGYFIVQGEENHKKPALLIPLGKACQYTFTQKPTDEFQLILYPTIALGDGRQANNPWLQELPDPITRTTWDNYATLSVIDAKVLGIRNWHTSDGALNGHKITLIAGEKKITLPALIQPGQAGGTIGLSLGYGQKEGLKKEMQVGVNAYVLYNEFAKVQNIRVEKAEGEHEFACIQLQNTLMGRGSIIKETTLEDFLHSDPPKEKEAVSLWESEAPTAGHLFKLSIDLNACTGCGACVIACHAENNVPVVGKEEVRRSRDMHWLRIDRYYSSTDSFINDAKLLDQAEGLETIGVLHRLEQASGNPQVNFQPVMCQHCNNAPCETVCPVAATSHGAQGQNQMVYNRCVGTRYCANNCPYKVRRFNWFQYSENDAFDFYMNDDIGRMVLNPDVTVRSRGVMEKCSFCIQQTQAIILKAKKENRPVAEGEFKNACACAAACNSEAMVFDDINDPSSGLREKIENKRSYALLEEIGTRPNVFYQAKVRNVRKSDNLPSNE